MGHGLGLRQAASLLLLMLLLQKLLPLSLFAALARLGGLLLTVTAVVTGGQVSRVTTSSFYVFLGPPKKIWPKLDEPCNKNIKTHLFFSRLQSIG